ncbi:hypothetical protein B0H11DRAFT_1916114 [Mycena galericulata]|nr:hypothetical protein B0H11DRAFT_1916114 [Mycena galericulata]
MFDPFRVCVLSGQQRECALPSEPVSSAPQQARVWAHRAVSLGYCPGTSDFVVSAQCRVQIQVWATSVNALAVPLGYNPSEDRIRVCKAWLAKDARLQPRSRPSGLVRNKPAGARIAQDSARGCGPKAENRACGLNSVRVRVEERRRCAVNPALTNCSSALALTVTHGTGSEDLVQWAARNLVPHGRYGIANGACLFHSMPPPVISHNSTLITNLDSTSGPHRVDPPPPSLRLRLQIRARLLCPPAHKSALGSSQEGPRSQLVQPPTNKSMGVGTGTGMRTWVAKRGAGGSGGSSCVVGDLLAGMLPEEIGEVVQEFYPKLEDLHVDRHVHIVLPKLGGTSEPR